MQGRPETLFALFAGLETLPGIGPKTAAAFAGIGARLPRDLLWTLPASGVSRARIATVRGAALPGVVTVEVTVGAHLAPRTKTRPWKVLVADAATEFELVFFRASAAELSRILPRGSRRLVSGRAEIFDGIVQMVHPDHILPLDGATLPAFEPVYPLAAGLTQRIVGRGVAAALDLAPDLAEWADPALVAREGWPAWRAALVAAHAPEGPEALSPDAPPRARLAYDELFAHQLSLTLARAADRRDPGRSSCGTRALQRKVLASLGYALTGAQNRAIREIVEDMAAPHRMNRLLQGDVGAGKTVVAFLALLVAVEAGGQGVLMAPTEILARQHVESLGPLAEATGVRLEVLTGRDRGPERADRLRALAAGEIDILVGTHAVFQRAVAFHDLRLAVIDEQHRFGVAQRKELGLKGRATDVLVMTATPIPRSLSLAQFGHMDVSVLDEKPPGRQPIATALVPAVRIDEVVAHLRDAVAAGRQAYWVCPLVEESAAVDLAAATDRALRLATALGAGRVALVHGQMPPAEKDAAMAAFARGRVGVLVATTVIEVGVNVPNATIMVIERAESFGLAQLHQLRGRVGRGSAASTCLLLYQPPLGEAAARRLTLLRDTEDGFRIAEEDLAIRGAGDVIGTAQSGLPRFRVADLERQGALMAVAQRDARALLGADPMLEGPRGQAARVLLHLLDHADATRWITVG